MLTRSSVHCAERIVAARSWNGVSNFRAQSSWAVPGYSVARRAATSRALPFGLLGRATLAGYRDGYPAEVPSTIFETSSSLPKERVMEILALSEAEALRLGRESLSDQARRSLSGLIEAVHFLLCDEDGQLVAYAQLRATEGDDELEFLGDHLNRELLDSAVAHARGEDRTVACWLHGLAAFDPPPAPSFHLTRCLRRLSLTLPGSPALEVPSDLSLRTFEPGRDEDAFLALNARSFASHPDQGRLTLAELRSRESEPWFDPSCFFLLEEGGDLLGFCWVKVHHDPWGHAGEIYVIGMDPAASGRGLGRLLLRTGLEAMTSRGLAQAFLYVEEGNDAARGLYEAEGFELAWFDALWRLETPSASNP